MKNLNFEIQLTIDRCFSKLTNLANRADQIEQKIQKLSSELADIERSAEKQKQIILEIGRKPVSAQGTYVPDAETISKNTQYNSELNSLKDEYIARKRQEVSETYSGSALDRMTKLAQNDLRSGFKPIDLN